MKYSRNAILLHSVDYVYDFYGPIVDFQKR